MSYCNGEFVWRPDLATHMERNGDEVTYTFDHWSPYVIAGDPDDDINPMSGFATGGLVMTGTNNGLPSSQGSDRTNFDPP